MKYIFLGIAMFIATFSSINAQQSEWLQLFNGKDLWGWKANENPSSFKVENGLLVCSGARGHLFYTAGEPYKNFELIAEIKTAPNANSGIFFHSTIYEKGWLVKGYEVQVNNTYAGVGNFRETKKTGSLYAIRNVYYPVANDNEWFTMRVKVI